MTTMTTQFSIGDRVLSRHMLPWDGTVVDYATNNAGEALLRVYWRYPTGTVSDHHANELQHP